MLFIQLKGIIISKILCFFIISGDLTDEEAIMDFLASPEALELEDQIEEVNARHLEKLVKERPFVAVFFCKFIELTHLLLR